MGAKTSGPEKCGKILPGLLCKDSRRYMPMTVYEYSATPLKRWICFVSRVLFKLVEVTFSFEDCLHGIKWESDYASHHSPQINVIRISFTIMCARLYVYNAPLYSSSFKILCLSAKTIFKRK